MMPCLGGEKVRDYQVRIILLDSTELHQSIKSTCKGLGLLQKAFDHLHLKETDYFGLRFLDNDNQTHWLDNNKGLGAQLKNLSSFVFYFGVKFYAADPCKLREEPTRYQFFLQVKRDILQGRLPVSFETGAELAALAVQSELGDYDSKRHPPGYVSEFRFIPNQTEEFENRATYVHKKLNGRVPSAAEYMYLDKVKWLAMYGVDLHPVVGEANVEYFVGLTPTGVVVYRNKTKVGNYFWPRITKVTFKNNAFMIRVKDKHNEENTYAFDCANKAACKHLWKCCVEHHAFFRLTQAQAISMQADRTFAMNSKYKYSGRTERQLAESQGASSAETSPLVVRVPSKRHERRSSNNARSHGSAVEDDTRSMVSAHGSTAGGSVRSATRRHRQSYESQQSRPLEHNNNDSPRNAPWEAHHQKGGLYTSGHDSPRSARSDKMMFPSRRTSNYSGSESEAASRRHRHYRRESDNDSEASGRRHRRRRRAQESGSEGESVYHNPMRHSRKSTESLAHLDAQWRDIQHRVRHRGHGGAGDTRSTHSNPAEYGHAQQRNGSLQSMPGSEGHYRHKQKRRGRSRSPGYRPPAEMQQHFKYIEPEPGMTQEQLMDIPYTKVETIVDPLRGRHSPHAARQRYRSPRRKANSDIVVEGKSQHINSSRPPSKDEGPPPYSPARSVGGAVEGTAGHTRGHPAMYAERSKSHGALHTRTPDHYKGLSDGGARTNESHPIPNLQTQSTREEQHHVYENGSVVSADGGGGGGNPSGVTTTAGSVAGSTSRQHYHNHQYHYHHHHPPQHQPTTSSALSHTTYGVQNGSPAVEQTVLHKNSPQLSKCGSEKHPRDDSGLGIENNEAASSTSSHPGTNALDQSVTSHTTTNHGAYIEQGSSDNAVRHTQCTGTSTGPYKSPVHTAVHQPPAHVRHRHTNPSDTPPPPAMSPPTQYHAALHTYKPHIMPSSYAPNRPPMTSQQIPLQQRYSHGTRTTAPSGNIRVLQQQRTTNSSKMTEL